VDTPVVGLYGPTSAKRWGPLGERSLAVESRLSGCGEMSLGFENNSAWDNCMAAIPVCDVIAAIDRLVQKNASREVGERAVCKTS
jgi:ADP-heptose:LPS heptosyltransferase